MTDTPKKFINIGIATSYLIGLPIGFITTFRVLSFEGGGIFAGAALGLLVAFVYSLWFAGKSIAENIQKDEGLLKTSYIYSLTVNKIIWSVFCAMMVIQNLRVPSLEVFLIPIVAFLVCTGLTTISIGLLIAWVVERRIEAIERRDEGNLY